MRWYYTPTPRAGDTGALVSGPVVHTPVLPFLLPLTCYAIYPTFTLTRLLQLATTGTAYIFTPASEHYAVYDATRVTCPRLR